MIKFVTVWFLIVTAQNHVNSGESISQIQIPFATQKTCLEQAAKYQGQDAFRLLSGEKSTAICQFGQLPLYVPSR